MSDPRQAIFSVSISDIVVAVFFSAASWYITSSLSDSATRERLILPCAAEETKIVRMDGNSLERTCIPPGVKGKK